MQQYLSALDSAVAGRPELQCYVVRCVHCGIRFLTDHRNPHRTDLRCPFGCRRRHAREASNRRSAKHRQTPRGKRAKHALNTKYYANHRRRTTTDDGRRQDLSLPTPPDAASPVAPFISADLPRLARLPTPPDAPSPAAQPSVTIGFSSGGVVSSEPAGLPVSLSARPEGPVNAPADASAAHASPAAIEIFPGGVVLQESDVARSGMVPYVQTLFRLIDGVRMTRDEVVRLLQGRFRQRSIARRAKIAYALSFLHQHPP